MPNQLKFTKVTTLPSTLDNSTMYLVPSTTPGYLDLHLSTLDGAASNRIINNDDVTALVASGLGNSLISSYSNYSSLLAATDQKGIAFVYDMTDYSASDPLSSTVRALFIWNQIATTPKWTLLSLYDTSSKQSIGRISEDADKNLTYRGLPIPVPLAVEAW